MAATPPKPASATSPTTSNSAPIGGVPATTPSQTSPSSSSADSSVGSTPLVASAPMSPSENTRKTLQEEGDKILTEILAIMDSHAELIETHHQSAIKLFQSMEEVKDIRTMEDDFFMSMRKDKDIITREWELMTEQVKSIIPKVKEGNPDSIDDFIQVKNTLLQKLNNQATSVSSFVKKVDEFQYRLNK